MHFFLPEKRRKENKKVIVTSNIYFGSIFFYQKYKNCITVTLAIHTLQKSFFQE